MLGDDAMHAWGWRLPFLVAAPLGLVGVYLRSRLEDTPVFRELEAKGEKEQETTTQFKDLLAGYWMPILRLGGMVVALNVVNYTLLTYMPTYLEKEIGLSADESLIVPIIGMLTMMIFVPFAGRAVRPDRPKTAVVGLAGRACSSSGVPMFLLMGTNLPGAIIGFAVLGLLYVPQLATISATFPAMFPTHVRYAGFAIAYNVSTSLFGGTAPAVNDWLTGEDRRLADAGVLHDGGLRHRCARTRQGPRDVTRARSTAPRSRVPRTPRRRSPSNRPTPRPDAADPRFPETIRQPARKVSGKRGSDPAKPDQPTTRGRGLSRPLR